jgi:hypothetical protein
MDNADATLSAAVDLGSVPPDVDCNMKMLVDAGVPDDTSSWDGDTVLYLDDILFHLEIHQYLLGRRVNPKVRSDSKSRLVEKATLLVSLVRAGIECWNIPYAKNDMHSRPFGFASPFKRRPYPTLLVRRQDSRHALLFFFYLKKINSGCDSGPSALHDTVLCW